MQNNILLSIIIPMFNSEATIIKTLDSINKSIYQRFEVILVDDFSNDKTIETINSFKDKINYDLKIINLNKNCGPGAARNKGAEEACGEVLIFIDSDVEIFPDTLTKIIDTFKKNPQISAIVGDYCKETGPTNFCTVYKNLFHTYFHGRAKTLTTIFFTGCGAIFRSVFLDVKGFDEHDILTVEDICLGYKLHNNNYITMLNPDIQVKHNKYFSFKGLLITDIFIRGIPWMKLIIKNKTYNNDLNTRTQDIINVVILYFEIFLLLYLILFNPVLIGPLILIYVLFFFLYNHSFFKYLQKNTDLVFSIKSQFMLMLYYLYCGFCFIIAIISVKLFGK